MSTNSMLTIRSQERLRQDLDDMYKEELRLNYNEGHAKKC